MTSRWLILAGAGIAGLGLIAADPALARPRQKATPVCADRPRQFTWEGFFFNGHPQPNGCAPAVFERGEYVGQDPDPNIRLQLRRMPDNGYTYRGP